MITNGPFLRTNSVLSLWGQPDIEIYRPLTQRPGDAGSQQLIVKTDAVDPLEALPIVRSAIKAADPNLALVGPNSLTEFVSQSIAQEKFLTGLLGTFAGVAVTLAVVGMASSPFSRRSAAVKSESGSRLAPRPGMSCASCCGRA